MTAILPPLTHLIGWAMLALFVLVGLAVFVALLIGIRNADYEAHGRPR